MKKIFTLIMVLAIILCNIPTQTIHASNKTISIEKISDDYYIETTIEKTYDDTIGVRASRISYDKVLRGKNKDGKVLWTLTASGTFEYNFTTCECVSFGCSATAPGETWSYRGLEAHKKNNTTSASVTASAYFIHSNALASGEFFKSVTLKCDKNGEIS